jgi:hypothetical protein
MNVRLIRDEALLRDLEPRKAKTIAHLVNESTIGVILTEQDSSINEDLLDSLQVGREIAPAFAGTVSEHLNIPAKYVEHSLYLSALILEYNTKNSRSVDKWQIRSALSDGNHSKIRNAIYKGFKRVAHHIPVRGKYSKRLSPKVIRGLEKASSMLSPRKVSQESLESLFDDARNIVMGFDRANRYKLKRSNGGLSLPDSPLPYIMALPRMHERKSLETVLSGQGCYDV